MHSSSRFEIERRFVCVAALLLCATAPALAQGRDATPGTHADSVRGTDSPDRAWWDVTFYDLHVRVNPADSSFAGWNGITYRVRRPGQTMQLDLQAPLVLDSVVQDRQRLEARREENAYFVQYHKTPGARAAEVPGTDRQVFNFYLSPRLGCSTLQASAQPSFTYSFDKAVDLHLTDVPGPVLTPVLDESAR